MNEPKQETPIVPVQAAQGPAAKAQKVRSSRYEWESKSGIENEKAAGASAASRRSPRIRQSDIEKILFRKPRRAQSQLFR
jgi:hypothetical protein